MTANLKNETESNTSNTKINQGKPAENFEAYLNVKNAIWPVFGEEGKRLLFLSDITGTNQVWSLTLKGPAKNGWPQQLTFFNDRVTGLYPNPSGSSFIFTQDQGGNEQDQFYLLEGDVNEGVTVTTLVNTPKYKNNFGAWRPDGRAFCFSSNRRHPAFFDIYTLELDGNSEPKLVYQADASLYPEAWSNDGRYILFRRANTNLDSDLFLLDLKAGSTEPRHLTPHQGLSIFSHSLFSNDDTKIYTISNLDRNFSAPASIEIASGKLNFLTTIIDKECDAIALSPDGQRLAFEINEEGYSNLFVLDLQKDSSEQSSASVREITGLPRGVALGIGLWSSMPVWSPDGKQLAFSFSSPVQNADIWLCDIPDTESSETMLEQVTFSPRGGLAFSRFVEPELVHFTAHDGLEIPGLLYLPPESKNGSSKNNGSNSVNSPLPFILFVHGGPESQTRFAWNPVLQYYVSRGYGILAPNVRGSSGYGKEYLALDDIGKRMDSVADLAAAVKWLNESGYADPKRIAVYGQSYGGFMVLAAVTTYPELWAAGVDIYGIANMLSFMENTSPYRLKMRTPEYGDPIVDRDLLIEISPIHKMEKITAPLMVIHGANDPRVPIGESEQMVKALKARNHPVEYQVFADEGHGITNLKNKLVAYPLVGDFLDKYLKS